MKEYRPSKFVIGKNIVYGVAGGLVAALILNAFLPAALACLLAIAAGGAIIYFAVYKDNISVKLDEKEVSFFRFGRLLYNFPREGTSFHAKIVTTQEAVSDSDCDLTVTTADGTEVTIDCSMLGLRTFEELLKDLGLTDKEPAKLETIKSNGREN